MAWQPLKASRHSLRHQTTPPAPLSEGSQWRRDFVWLNGNSLVADCLSPQEEGSHEKDQGLAEVSKWCIPSHCLLRSKALIQPNPFTVGFQKTADTDERRGGAGGYLCWWMLQLPGSWLQMASSPFSPLFGKINASMLSAMPGSAINLVSSHWGVSSFQKTTFRTLGVQ